jgi:hypothetical protein
LQIVKALSDEVENLKPNGDSLKDYERSATITGSRKLSSTGNFTGTVAGRAANLLLSEIDSNKNQINYIASQFANGQTGYVIDGGFFEDAGIRKNYNGGMF